MVSPGFNSELFRTRVEQHVGCGVEISLILLIVLSDNFSSNTLVADVKFANLELCHKISLVSDPSCLCE